MEFDQVNQSYAVLIEKATDYSYIYGGLDQGLGVYLRAKKTTGRWAFVDLDLSCNKCLEKYTKEGFLGVQNMEMLCDNKKSKI